MVLMKKSMFQELYNHSLKELPNEGCGLLAGIIEKGDKMIKKVYLLTNLDHSPEHFTMDQKEQFQVIKDIRENGWTLIGNFHSHPASPSRPSDEDKRLAFDPNFSYLIISLQDKEHPVLKSFNITKESVREETIKII